MQTPIKRGPGYKYYFVFETYHATLLAYRPSYIATLRPLFPSLVIFPISSMFSPSLPLSFHLPRIFYVHFLALIYLRSESLPAAHFDDWLMMLIGLLLVAPICILLCLASGWLIPVLILICIAAAIRPGHGMFHFNERFHRFTEIIT